MGETLFATDASATAHNDEAVFIEVAGAEYALPPSTARAFVDDLAAAIEEMDEGEEGEAADEKSPPIPIENQAFPEDFPGDEPTPEPRDHDPDAERVLCPAGESTERVATGERDTEPALEYEPGEEVAVVEAAENSAGLHCYLGADIVDAVQERAATVADRVTVRERGETYELALGESDEWPDYTVGASSITVGAPGCRVLGIDAGDEVRVIAREDVLKLQPLVDEDDTLTDAADWTPEGGTADDEDLVELSTPDAGPRRECQNCGSSVSAQYVKVHEPDGVEQPRCCPDCEDLIRDGNGVREKRSG